MEGNIKLYASILLFGFAIYKLISILFAKNQDAKALQWAQADEPVKSKNALIELSRSLVHQFTLQHAIRIKSVTYRKRISRAILTSGLNRELNVDEFIGLQILWGVLFPIVLITLNFALQLGYPYFFFFLMIPVGYYIPLMHANAQRKIRVRQVLADLPFFIDLLALSVEAGLDLQGGIQRIVEKSRGASVLADELDQVLRDITLGSSRADALRGLANRLDMSEISSFVNVIIDADSTGASITRVLKDQTAQMRTERFVRAEKAGARASQAILIPLILFIIPAVFIMIFAPVALNMMYGNK